MPIDPRYVPENTPALWTPIQKASFADWIESTFKYTGSNELFTQQRFVRDFMQPQSPYRGLLLYHGLGVGKTTASIATAEPFLADPTRGICVMLPASLRQNFIREIQRYGNNVFSTNKFWKFCKKADVEPGILEDARLTEAKYDKIHNNDKKLKGVWIPSDKKKSNFSSQSAANQKSIRKQLSDTINGYYNFLHYNGMTKEKINSLTSGNKINPFNNKIVIIDEVHNFISRVVNKGKTAPILYALLMSAYNCKIIMLSGTPLINYPHEIAYLMNLARGPLDAYSLNCYKGSNIDDYLKSSPYIFNAMWSAVVTPMLVRPSSVGRGKWWYQWLGCRTRSGSWLKIQSLRSCSLHQIGEIQAAKTWKLKTDI